MNWKIIRLEETESTNIYINKVEGTDVVVIADHQTAGKGMGTNTWESDAGQNLLLSVKTSPKGVTAHDHFLLSMTGALALRDTLNEYAYGFTIKWPNDIYWHDKKISGTLIETTITGRHVKDCIFGIGLNVNQHIFRSDAPNPISLCTIMGHDIDREQLLIRLLNHLEMWLSRIDDEVTIAKTYNASLYRNQGWYEYEDADGRFMAMLKEVNAKGHLVLCDRQEKNREYDIKEVKFII